MDFSDYKKNYLTGGKLSEHSKLVSKLSLKLFEELKGFFPWVREYDNKQDLMLLEYGAYLHDIGVIFEKKQGRGHHKIGRDLILENKISNLSERENLIVANIIRYHRKSLPSLVKHACYRELTDEERKKTNLFAAIVRLADALDYRHFNLADDFETDYDEKSNVLTITLSINIMLNVGFKGALKKKKKLLEKVLGTKVLIR